MNRFLFMKELSGCMERMDCRKAGVRTFRKH